MDLLKKVTFSTPMLYTVLNSGTAVDSTAVTADSETIVFWCKYGTNSDCSIIGTNDAWTSSDTVHTFTANDASNNVQAQIDQPTYDEYKVHFDPTATGAGFVDCIKYGVKTLQTDVITVNE